MQISTSSHSRYPAVMIFFNRQWWWTTVLVIVAMGVLVRLGFWQLDRLEQRRAYNADIIAKLALPPISLNDEQLPADLATLKNRQAEVRGTYDFSRQLALTQQRWMNTPGFHLITPLVIDAGARSEDIHSLGEERPLAVLVDRGWLPARDLGQEKWSQYDLGGPLSVTGYVRLSHTLPNVNTGEQAVPAFRTEWYRVDIDAIEAQMPYELLPVYLQQVPPADGNTSLPFRGELEPDLSDGPHLSYAIQWFIFATILAVGYVYFVRKRTDQELDSRWGRESFRKG